MSGFARLQQPPSVSWSVHYAIDFVQNLVVAVSHVHKSGILVLTHRIVTWSRIEVAEDYHGDICTSTTIDPGNHLLGLVSSKGIILCAK
ncbi:MAG: hypothetical protein VCF24_05265 [Candidatus Latescibacterota bacterium]